MRAHNAQGELYKSFTSEERQQFDELRRKKPSKEHLKWILDKLNSLEMDYPSKFYHYGSLSLNNGKKFLK